MVHRLPRNIVPIILAIFVALASLSGASQYAAARHRDEVLKIADAACYSPKAPEAYLLPQSVEALGNASAVMYTSAEISNLVGDKASENAKVLRKVAKELDEKGRKVDNYYYLARQWNLYTYSGCALYEGSSESELEAFMDSTLTLPVKIAARTSPGYHAYEMARTDPLLLELLASTPPEVRGQAMSFLDSYGWIGPNVVDQFGAQLLQAEELAKNQDLLRQFLQMLRLTE